FFFQAEDGIRDFHVTGVQTCALPILPDQPCREVWVDAMARGLCSDRVAVRHRVYDAQQPCIPLSFTTSQVEADADALRGIAALVERLRECVEGSDVAAEGIAGTVH